MRYNDFWPNYSDRYVAIELPEKIMVELDDELYPSSVEVLSAGETGDFQRLCGTFDEIVRQPVECR